VRRSIETAKPTHWSWLAALALGISCGRAPDAAQDRPKTVPVVVGTVEQRDVPFEIPAFGTVEASSTVDLVSQVTGLVTRIHFKEGDLVKKGDLLFSVDTRPYRASMAVAQAELERNRAMAEQARAEAERAERLAREGLASEQQLEKARADERSTAATVKLGQATLQSAGINLALARITAPMDGRAGSLLVHAGNVVRAGDPQPLVVIRSLSPVQVRFAVPEQYAGPIRDRMKQGPLNVRVTPKGEGAKSVEAPLTFYENTVDPTTGTLALKATFQNAERELWPGAAVSVALVLDVDRRATVVPESSVQAGQDGPYAFVVENGKARLRRVVIARTHANLAVIESGLKVGERVVVDGQARLRDGAQVSAKPPAVDRHAELDAGGAGK
jgi:multidrug efflux system membrane fusion protein